MYFKEYNNQWDRQFFLTVGDNTLQRQHHTAFNAPKFSPLTSRPEIIVQGALHEKPRAWVPGPFVPTYVVTTPVFIFLLCSKRGSSA